MIEERMQKKHLDSQKSKIYGIQYLFKLIPSSFLSLTAATPEENCQGSFSINYRKKDYFLENMGQIIFHGKR